MFTFGIFSTHLPYLIMVGFYAVFLLFGDTKIVSEPTIELEYAASDITLHSIYASQKIEIDFVAENSIGKLSKESYTNYKFIITSIPKGIYIIPLKTVDYCFTWFSRPPPVS